MKAKTRNRVAWLEWKLAFERPSVRLHSAQLADYAAQGNAAMCETLSNLIERFTRSVVEHEAELAELTQGGKAA